MRSRLHGGVPVHVSHDEHGAIEVVDDAGVRALHFGTPHRQSAMALADPHRLELAYTRAMLAALPFLSDEPRRVLLVGLGGGSLAKFLWRYLPQCRIDAVERRDAVARIAQGWFGLPADERLTVRIADGADYVVEAARRDDAYDLILLDAYDGVGMAAAMLNPAFLDRCAALLSPGGACAANLWGNNRPLLEHALDTLRQSFAGTMLRLPVPGRGNVIGLAFPEPAPRPDWRKLQSRADSLERVLGVEFPALVRLLRRANSGWAERLLGRSP
jgi:spermidine synthase